MRFKRYGRTRHLRIETAADMEAVLSLDASLWMATSAPVSAFRSDPAFLRYLDADHSGRVTTRDVRAAITWLFEHLANRDAVERDTPSLLPSDLRTDSDSGRRAAAAAGYILQQAGHPDEAEITLKEVRDFIGRLNSQPMNGDGVLVPSAATDDALRAYLQDIIAALGGTTDAGGEQGVGEPDIDRFQQAVDAYLAWQARAVGDDGEADRARLPFGDDTAALYALLNRHADRVDLYFAQCAAQRFASPVPEAGPVAVFEPPPAARETADIDAWLQRQPLAVPRPEPVLPLAVTELNPFYASWLQQLRRELLARVADGDAPATLTAAAWTGLKARFEGYAAYLDERRGAEVASLPPARLRACRDGALAGQARALIAQDASVSEIRKGALDLEKLLLFQSGLLRFLNNFVSLTELYDMRRQALFESGSAVIDGRWFGLAIRVEDAAAHSAQAQASGLFTLYLQLTAPGEAPFTVAVPATSGSKGNLGVGKRGVFFDINGREWDARVTQLIANPISLHEALAAPFIRLWSFIVGKIEAISASTEKELQKSADVALAAPPGSPAPGTPPPAGATAAPGAPPPPGLNATSSLFVGLSVSAAAMGSAFAFITKTFAGMSRAQVLTGFVGAALIVLLPVSLLAVLKLRRQDLSSLLEGCGWAVNARMRLTRHQRRQFTRRVPYPR